MWTTRPTTATVLTSPWDAQDSGWLNGWLPDKGATLRPKILGFDWERPGDHRRIECGLFVLDDVSFSDAPTTLQLGA